MKRSGATEKPMIPSIAKLIILAQEFFVFPAKRSSRS